MNRPTMINNGPTMVNLVFPVMEPDEFGIDQVIEEDKTRVYGEIKSITAAEFFNAGRDGLRPEFRVDVFFADYDGQKIVELEDGRQFEVYRTYLRKDDMIEIYCRQQGATNGKVVN